MKLAGKTALITGGGSGIGLATARLFAAEGARVAITGRTAEKLEKARREIGAGTFAGAADVGDFAAFSEAVSRVAEALGGLDIVFANAGIGASTPLGATDPAVFETVIRTNLTGVFFTLQAALPHLRDGGSLILSGSVHAVLGAPGYSAYAASKAGVRAMTRVLASELSPRNWRVPSSRLLFSGRSLALVVFEPRLHELVEFLHLFVGVGFWRAVFQPTEHVSFD